MRRLFRRPSHATVVAYIALFVALGGSAMAAYVVSSNNDIGPGTVSGGSPPNGAHSNIIGGSVTGGDVADGSLNWDDIAQNAITSSRVKDGSLFGADLADGSVDWADIALNAITNSRVKDGSLVGADLGNDTLTGTQINESTVGTVPNATHATDA